MWIYKELEKRLCRCLYILFLTAASFADVCIFSVPPPSLGIVSVPLDWRYMRWLSITYICRFYILRREVDSASGNEMRRISWIYLSSFSSACNTLTVKALQAERLGADLSPIFHWWKIDERWFTHLSLHKTLNDRRLYAKMTDERYIKDGKTPCERPPLSV